MQEAKREMKKSAKKSPNERKNTEKSLTRKRVKEAKKYSNYVTCIIMVKQFWRENIWHMSFAQ